MIHVDDMHTLVLLCRPDPRPACNLEKRGRARQSAGIARARQWVDLIQFAADYFQ